LVPGVVVVSNSATEHLQRAYSWRTLYPEEAINRLRLADDLLNTGETEIDLKWYTKVCNTVHLEYARFLALKINYEPLVTYRDFIEILIELNLARAQPSDIGFNKRSWQHLKRETYFDAAKFLYWYCLFETPERIGGKGRDIKKLLKLAKKTPEDIGASQLEINNLALGKATNMVALIAPWCLKFHGSAEHFVEATTRDCSGLRFSMALPGEPYVIVLPMKGSEREVISFCDKEHFERIDLATAVRFLETIKKSEPGIWDILRTAFICRENPVSIRIQTVKLPGFWKVIAYDKSADTLTEMDKNKFHTFEKAAKHAEKLREATGWDPNLIPAVRSPLGRIYITD
jgi:hypothetical protein